MHALETIHARNDEAVYREWQDAVRMSDWELADRIYKVNPGVIPCQSAIQRWKGY